MASLKQSVVFLQLSLCLLGTGIQARSLLPSPPPAFSLPALPLTSSDVFAFVGRLTDCVSRDPNLIRFYVANDLSNHTSYKEVVLNDTASLQNSGINADLPLKVLIHGYNQNLTSVFPQNVKEAYLANQETLNNNILIVDYGALGNAYVAFTAELTDLNFFNCYAQAAYNVDRIAKRVAEMLQFLINQNYTTLGQIHIVGHSLGGQVGGSTGNYLKQFNNGTAVARFTALDPAAPGFRPELPGLRSMTPEDAEFEDVIHTSAFFGEVGPSGQVDIIVNLGIALQPSCVSVSSATAIFGTVADAATIGAYCSHSASTTTFAESISNNGMIAKNYVGPGNATAIVGEFCDTKTERGIYTYNYLGDSSTTAVSQE